MILRRQAVNNAGLYFALCAVMLCGGCGRAINRTAERRIREALPNVIGPARQYKAHVESAATSTLRGRLARVTIDGSDVEPGDGLLLDTLHLELEGVRYDSRRDEVSEIKTARFEISLSASTIDEYLAGESPQGESIRHPRVTFSAGNHVTIKAERVVLGVGVPFEISGPLQIASPRRLRLDPTRLVVVGIPLTGVLMRFVLSRFEGASDLKALPFPVQLTDAHTTNEAVFLGGTADAAAILRQAQQTRRPSASDTRKPEKGGSKADGNTAGAGRAGARAGGSQP